jgi:hypothetical protein
MALPPTPWLQRALPRFGRRLVVLDPGSRFVKVLVVDAAPGALRVVHFETLHGAEADPEQAERLAEDLDRLLVEAGPHERVLVLPQYRSISALVELPPDRPEDRHTTLLREARRLSGLDETALAWHAVDLKPFGRYAAPCWLTLCKREELDHLLARFAPPAETPGAEPPDLAEVIPSGQALMAAAVVLAPPESHAVLVDLRARNSVVAIVARGQGVGTATVPLGLQHLETALGRTLTAPPSPGGAAPAENSRPAVVQEWASGIRLALTEWLEDNPELGLTPADFRGFLAGLGATDAELRAALNQPGAPRFEDWEAAATAGRPWPLADYLTCYGAALQTLKRAPAGISLLPEPARVLHRRRRALATVLSAGVLLMTLLALVLAAGIWQKRGLIERKRVLTRQSQAALQTALEIDRLYRELNLDYERVYPVLERQRQTLETLQVLAAVRDSRTNDAFWYVLFADAARYEAGTSGLARLAPPGTADRRPALTNAPPATNAPAPTAAPAREFIAEMCIPLEGEALRRVLSDVAANLKQNVLFRRVDALPDERRRDLVDPRVAVSNRVFSLALEVAGRELPPPRPLAPRSKPAPDRAPRRPSGSSAGAGP